MLREVSSECAGNLRGAEECKCAGLAFDLLILVLCGLYVPQRRGGGAAKKGRERRGEQLS